MAADINDSFNKTFNAANPVVARVSAVRSTGVTTLTCDALTGWPTDTAVHFSTYKVNTSNEVTPGSQTDWKGIVSGSTIGSLERKAGAADSGNAIGDYVEMNPTGSWGDDLISGILVAHNQDGSLKDDAVTGDVIEDGAVTAAKQGDSDWINPSLLNSYIVQNSRTVSYRKIGNLVFLRGQIGKATLDVNTMFNLPAGYRPPTGTAPIFTVPGSTLNYGKIQVTEDGNVNLGGVPSAGAYVGLDVVRFLVD